MKLLRSVLPVMMVLLLLPGCSKASDLDNVLVQARKDGKSVVLELGSVGCIACEQMKPVIQKLRGAYAGTVEVVFVDVRQDKKTGRRFGAHMIPTQVFLDKEGKEFHRHIGYYSYEDIVAVLDKHGVTGPR